MDIEILVVKILLGTSRYQLISLTVWKIITKYFHDILPNTIKDYIQVQKKLYNRFAVYEVK